MSYFHLSFIRKKTITKQLADHFTDVLSTAQLDTSPFPHMVVDNVFPNMLYQELLKNLPSTKIININNHFAHVKIEETDTSFSKMNGTQKKFWLSFELLAKELLFNLITKHLRIYIDEKISSIFDKNHILKERYSSPDSWLDNDFKSTRGIIQYRENGAFHDPHVDKATALFTCVFYFAQEGNPEGCGTVLYKSGREQELIEKYREARSIRAWYPNVDDFDIRPIKQVAYKPNRAVIMVGLPNSLHGVENKYEFPRYSMQSFCELPLNFSKQAFSQWRDITSATGLYVGDD